MSGFDLTLDARANLDAIAGYVANDAGPARAVKVVSDIRDACRKLGEMPGIGHFREDLLDRRYKFWSVHSYVIAYRWEATPIQVIAVVHGARSLSSFFRRRGP